MSFQQLLEITDESMQGEDTRAGLIKRKLGNFITSVKTADSAKCVFNATCNGIPQDIQIGTQLEFEIVVEPQQQNGNSETEPEISLDSCTMMLTAQTSGPNPTHIEVLRQRQWAQRPPGPFSKAHGYRKTVDLGVLGHVPSTFNFEDVSQSYKLRLEIQFHAANNTIVMKRECPVNFKHPDASTRRGDSIASSIASYEATMLDEDNFGLPTYEEATSGAHSTTSRQRQ